MAVRQYPNNTVLITDNKAYFELNADTANDLTDLSSIGGLDIEPGSLCLVIETGHIYALNGSGTWVDQMEDS
jgi:hypothetical protein